VGLLAAMLMAHPQPQAILAQTPGPPNMVLILSDDQRSTTLKYESTVWGELFTHGVKFNNAIVPNSLCCPSRASILTGKFSHSTGIYTNTPPLGGAPMFGPSSTLATWLHDAGYHTGMFGKYLNEYEFAQGIPPGWDD